MYQEFPDNRRQLTTFLERRIGRFSARVIPWFFTYALASRAFVMIGVGVPVGTTIWTLVASSIFAKTQR